MFSDNLVFDLTLSLENGTILKRYEEVGTTMVRAKPGRPKKSNDCDERALSRLSKTNPKLTSRQLKENWATKYTSKTVKFGGGSIMVWGFIKRSGLRKIVRVDGIINSAKYTGILEETLVPYIVEGDIFQQDGAPCHASKSTMAYFEEKVIAILAFWPSQSPDFNITEQVWEILKRKMMKKCPKSVNELWQMVEKKFYAIPDKEIENLFASLPKRVKSCLKTRGWSTKY